MSAPRLTAERISELACEQFLHHEGRPYKFEGAQPWVVATVDAATAPLLDALQKIADGSWNFGNAVPGLTVTQYASAAITKAGATP